MFESFFKSKKWIPWAYGGGLLLLILLCTQVYMSVLLNYWYKDFWNLLEIASQSNILEFWHSLIYFAKVVFPYIGSIIVVNFLSRVYALRWREAMSFHFIKKWMKMDGNIEGASQRIQQDTESFANIVEGIGLQIARSIMTLIAFIPILWDLSKFVIIPYLETIAGSLVWISLSTSAIALVAAWYVGYYLPGLEFNNQVVEARYRKQLVKGEDDRSLIRMPNMLELFAGVRLNYQKLFIHYSYFDLYLNVFQQTMVLVPFILMAPGLFSGLFALGIVMQTNNAFTRVNTALDVVLNNWTTINRLRSVVKRLRGFEENLIRQGH